MGGPAGRAGHAGFAPLVTHADFERQRRSARSRYGFFLDPGPPGGPAAAWNGCGFAPSALLCGWGGSLAERTTAGRSESWMPRGALDPYAALDAWLTGRAARGETVAGYVGYEFGRSRANADPLVPDLMLGSFPSVSETEADRVSVADRPPSRLDLVEPRGRYLSIISAAIERILAGDFYQVNLSQPFRVEGVSDPAAAYEGLRQRCPVPYGARWVAPGFEILSASPECFLTVRGRTVTTRPIKGTRPRGTTPSSDRALADELMASVKDRAELTMIVDMERNDLGRVCETGSVTVPALCELESFPNVHHLVATVTGRLRSDVTPGRLLQATFPGGSVTGCPKIEAMKWIRELERGDRGPYCGAIGIFRPDGSMDLSIAIRTGLWLESEQAITVRSGAGITAQSDPAAEYDEILAKAAAFGVPSRHMAYSKERP